MTIREVTEETEITSGQWVCPAPLNHDRICDAPRKVAKTSAARVYLLESNGMGLGSFIARKTCLYVCDTDEEAAAVFCISREQASAIADSNEAIRAEYRARIAALNTGELSA